MTKEFDPLEGAITAVLLALLSPLSDLAIARVLAHASQWHEDRQDEAAAERSVVE